MLEYPGVASVFLFADHEVTCTALENEHMSRHQKRIPWPGRGGAHPEELLSRIGGPQAHAQAGPAQDMRALNVECG